MSTLAGEFWVCGQCRSINNAGARQCYNCRTPKDRAAVDPATIDPSSHGQLREIELPPFRPSRGVAMLVSVGIVAIAIMQAYNTFIAASVMQLRIDGREIAPNQLEFANTVGILTIGIAALALIGWSLWLSRAVTAMPALGLGYPAADGFMAFVENFLPGLNLYRVPAIVRDVVHRLEPGSIRGEAVIFGSWLALLGGVLIPRIGAAVTGTTLQSGPDVLRTAMVVAIISSVLTAIGAFGLIALIWWVEGRIAVRRAAQLAGATATPSPAEPAPSPPTASAPPPMPEATQSPVQPFANRSAFAAAGASATRPTEAPVDEAMGPDASTAPAPPVSSPTATPRFDLPQVQPTPPPAEETDDVFAQVVARRMESASVETAALEAAPPDVPAPEPPVVETVPEPPAAAVEAPLPVEPAKPVEVPAPVEPAEPVPAPRPDPGPTVPSAGPPHVTINVGPRGMITAEMDGEAEHIILDDLTAYGEALAKVAGTAAIVASTDDSMAGLIARRAQRILEDAGVRVTVD